MRNRSKQIWNFRKIPGAGLTLVEIFMRRNMRTMEFIIVLLFIVISTGCNKSNSVENTSTTGYVYSVPEKTDDGWNTEDISKVGGEKAPLEEMMNYIKSANNHQLHNILIFKKGKLVFEEYFKTLNYYTSPPSLGSDSILYNKDLIHYLASESKSVTSILFGIAVKKGFITSDMNTILSSVLPQYSNILTGQKSNITLKSLLTMTSGLDWDENSYPYGDQRNDVTRLFYESDPIGFILSKNSHGLPGTVFRYNSGVTNVLGEIVRQKSGSTLLKFAEDNLFQQLGITKDSWSKIRGNIYFASGGLSLRARDLAKIGLLFLTNGYWNGNEIVSKEWLDASSASYINPNTYGFANGYGFQWWINSTQINGEQVKIIISAGLGEQYMMIIPSKETIVVFNCGYFGVPVNISPFLLFNNYIFRALDSD